MKYRTGNGKVRAMGRMDVLSALCAVFVLGYGSNADAQEFTFEHVRNIGTKGRGPAQFMYVEDFAFDSQGRLLVTDAAHAWVQVFDKTTGKYISRFGGKGDEDDQLEKPEGIAVDPDGNVFVADYTTGYVKKYDKDFKWLTTFSDYGTQPGQNIKSEFISIYNGLLYLPEAGNHRVSVFDLVGNFKFLFGEFGTGEGQLNNPEAAKANSKGEIEKWIEEHGNTATAAHRGQILVVDDEPVIRHVFRTWLEDDGYRVAEAGDGAAALALIDDEPFDLVFLDLQMPGTNGVETLRQIRDQVAAQDVVVVTGHYDGTMMDEVLSMGPAHVLKKPVDKEQFIEAVRLYTAQSPVQ
ncbi:MAG: response regulator [Kiritimatiellia bacterium]|jgi:CheY-like chemotaxis protein|nr:response regulator [Kiritimatiellia bacterium]